MLLKIIYHGKHKTIPVSKKDYRSVIESSHEGIEYKFYDVERFDSLEMFLSQAYTHILYWTSQKNACWTKSILWIL